MGHGARERTWTEIERRIVSGDLSDGTRLDEAQLAEGLGVDVAVVREALCRLERDGFVRADADGSFSVAPLTEIELREGYPVAILLEGLAVRSTAAFPADGIARLRQINVAMADASGDPLTVATLDWQFHDELVRHCGNDQLLGTLRPLKRMLLRYEHTYMSTADFVDRSIHQHEDIVRALEHDDREGAAELVESNFRDALPGMLDRFSGQ